MSEIITRLEDTSKTCIEAFKSWDSDKKNNQAREDLLEAVHDLRKVTSRMEIELAIAEREENARGPIPIPSHRDANKKTSRGGNGAANSADDNAGNRADDGDTRPAPKSRGAGGGGRTPRGRGRKTAAGE